jgi:hypothetical protein
MLPKSHRCAKSVVPIQQHFETLVGPGQVERVIHTKMIVTDEVLASAVNLLIARGAYRAAARLYPEDLIELRQGVRIIERNKS